MTRTLELNVTEAALAAWERGEGLIQELMPNLTADEREFIMTGAVSEEWDAAFKE